MAHSRASRQADTPPGLRVGLCSPSALFLAAVVGWLRHDGEIGLQVVTPVLDVEALVAGVGAGSPDVVVLDGQILAQFLATDTAIPRVVVVARPGQPLPAPALLAAGVRGFLLAESCTGSVLATAVRAAAAGHVFVQDDVVDRLWKRGLAAGQDDVVPHDLLRLTDRERQVWRLLATGQSNRQIALHVQSRGEAIGMAYRLGAS